MIKRRELIIQETYDWVNSFVIAYNLCPFAQRVVERGELAIDVTQASMPADILQALMLAIHTLDDNPQIETTLLIIPDALQDFLAYLDFVDRAETMMMEQGYEGMYQLATFHPDYCFSGVSEEDVSNYTNRSPYPTLHLLREESIETAIQFYGDTKNIPIKNIALLHQLGLKKVLHVMRSITR